MSSTAGLLRYLLLLVADHFLIGLGYPIGPGLLRISGEAKVTSTVKQDQVLKAQDDIDVCSYRCSSAASNASVSVDP